MINHRLSRAGNTGQSGFSMVELLVVISITAILTAIAIPQVFNMVYASRIRGAANGLAGLVQQGRMLAEQQNKTIPVLTGNIGTNAPGAFIGVNGTTWQSGDPSVGYAASISNASASNVPTALSPGFTAEPAGTTLYFNWRGAPVTSSGAYMSPKGVIFYLSDTHNNWAAVSVSSAGRAKVWMLSGTSWR